MSQSLRNPDSRPLPEGWAEHFDSARHIWYYVDLNVEPPRVTFAHPCDLDGQYPSSAPARVKEHPSINRNIQKPTGPRKNSSVSVNAIIRETQRARRATVAQQMYASSMTSSSSSTASTSGSISRRSSIRASESPVEGAGCAPKGAAVSSKNVSPTSPTGMHLDTHDPRNFFDCTRLAPGSRRMTVNGSHSSTPSFQNQHRSSSNGAVYSLYPSSVNPSPSPLQPPKDLPDGQRSAQPTPSARTPIITFSGNFSPPAMMISSSPTPDRSTANSTSPTNLDILQPKPIRPMKGISLNLQVQVAAGIADTPSYTDNAKSAGRNPLLKNFRFSTGKMSSKGKGRSHSREADEVASRMDNSLVLIDAPM
ncbi:hypothetical protein D9613_002004 [Agrocybe pediades]|uniref:WW domain-containing protein n=1 Tax=Agrocybe pediades TaxID=84607 RepID=A0A8H4VUK5_9AGAR|nr:hypothetical protein D9613_002004 [Agrocybe pediades]